jgi:predicted nucleic acid-binding protein
MIHGVDTGFLVAAEVAEHVEHSAARQKLAEFVVAGDRIAIAPQVLAEFIHVVTDPRRFTQPLDLDQARDLAEQWWTASDIDHVFPNDTVTQQFLAWLQQFSLGRKRLLDTLLAATYLPGGNPIDPHNQCVRLCRIRRLQLRHTKIAIAVTGRLDRLLREQLQRLNDFCTKHLPP